MLYLGQQNWAILLADKMAQFSHDKTDFCRQIKWANFIDHLTSPLEYFISIYTALQFGTNLQVRIFCFTD